MMGWAWKHLSMNLFEVCVEKIFKIPASKPVSAFCIFLSVIFSYCGSMGKGDSFLSHFFFG